MLCYSCKQNEVVPDNTDRPLGEGYILAKDKLVCPECIEQYLDDRQTDFRQWVEGPYDDRNY